MTQYTDDVTEHFSQRFWKICFLGNFWESLSIQFGRAKVLTISLIKYEILIDKFFPRTQALYPLTANDELSRDEYILFMDLDTDVGT